MASSGAGGDRAWAGQTRRRRPECRRSRLHGRHRSADLKEKNKISFHSMFMGDIFLRNSRRTNWLFSLHRDICHGNDDRRRIGV